MGQWHQRRGDTLASGRAGLMGEGRAGRVRWFGPIGARGRLRRSAGEKDAGPERWAGPCWERAGLLARDGKGRSAGWASLSLG